MNMHDSAEWKRLLLGKEINNNKNAHKLEWTSNLFLFISIYNEEDNVGYLKNCTNWIDGHNWYIVVRY